jgi:hypothetical protein
VSVCFGTTVAKEAVKTLFTLPFCFPSLIFLSITKHERTHVSVNRRVKEDRKTILKEISGKVCRSASSSDTAGDRTLLHCAAKSPLLAVKFRSLTFQETLFNIFDSVHLCKVQ